MKKSTFKRSRNKWDNNERTALDDVLMITDLHPKQLITDHDEKSFKWHAGKSDNGLGNLFFFDKETHTEQEAKNKAIYRLDTFEGNLLEDHTETHYGFQKVRE